MNDLNEPLLTEPLSGRELEILRLLAEGLTNREVAQKLILSPETVKWYNKQIYSKLGVSSRTQAVARAREIGLFDEPDEGSVAVPVRPRHNLPAELSSFIGREQEIAEVKRLLESARLVTLTGPGGAGKTRLSQRVAVSMVGNYADGVCFVALAATPEPELVPNSIAKVLGVVEQPNRPLVESLGRFLLGKQMLLVLDNYEHVMEAASLVTELLAAAPRLSIVATSREVLRLNGEFEYPVPPLILPDPTGAGSVAELSGYESVALFVQRAEASSPSFRLTEENAPAVAGICARLDGLPLAIELAAAKIKLFRPQQILERLENRLGLLTRGSRDLPERQRTLRDTIDWSYNLLDEDERRLFARLGVFSGGRSLEAVEGICGPGLDIDALDGLESLLNKSLLYQEEGPVDEPRFIMLETIHEYARERLKQSGEERQIRDRHLDYFLSLAEKMEPGYRREGQLLLLARTEAEMGNLRAAFNWALENNKVEAAARLVSSIEYFLTYMDQYVEGYAWIKRVLGSGATIQDQYQLKLLTAASRLAWGDYDRSQYKRFCTEALSLAREMNDKHGEARALIELGISSINEPEAFEEAVGQAEAGLVKFRELDDEPWIAQTLNILGELARTAGDYDRAQELYEECMALCRKTGEIIRQAFMLENLAYVAYHQGEYARARDLAVRDIKQWSEIGGRQGLCVGLTGLAGPLGKLGESEKAARLLGVSAALLAERGLDHQPSDQHEVTKYTADVRAQLDEATFKVAWAEGQAMTLDAAVTYALEGE